MKRHIPVQIEWHPDPAQAVPVYRQILEWMYGKMESGEWPAGTRLPSQREMARHFQVNRSTLNQALKPLLEAGVLQGRGSQGTVVASTAWSLRLPVQPDWNRYMTAGYFRANQEVVQAINTLDSMVGYKNEKYRAIGCVSARMDDLANLIPARLGWLLLSAAAGLLGMPARQALRLGWRDRYQHKSPNSGWSEATVAGALGIRLGGPNTYFGERVDKPWMGDEQRPIEQEDIRRTIRLMYVASTLALVLFALVSWLVKDALV